MASAPRTIALLPHPTRLPRAAHPTRGTHPLPRCLCPSNTPATPAAPHADAPCTHHPGKLVRTPHPCCTCPTQPTHAPSARPPVPTLAQPAHYARPCTPLPMASRSERKFKVNFAKRLVDGVKKNRLDLDSRKVVKAQDEEKKVRDKAKWIAQQVGADRGLGRLRWAQARGVAEGARCGM